MTFSNIPDNILDAVLALFDEGVSVVDIVARFPEHKDELTDLFSMISLVSHEGRQLPLPSRESLQTALRSLPEVTEAPIQRYSMQEEATASSYIIGIFNSFESLMTAHWKSIGSFGAVAIVALFFFAGNVGQNDTLNTVSQESGTLSQESSDTQQEPSSANATQGRMMSATMLKSENATGDVDEAIGVFLADAHEEQAVLDEDATLVLASADSATLNEFDTTISSYEY